MPHPWTPPPKPVEERPKVATPLSPLQLARQQLERVARQSSCVKNKTIFYFLPAL
jgi:hypothetical protein